MKIILNTEKTLSQIKNACARAQAAVVPTALSDCNRFCKKKTGRLMASARGDTITGELSWNTPYARKAYYTGIPDTKANPYASRLWAQKAAKSYGGKWLSVIRKELFK